MDLAAGEGLLQVMGLAADEGGVTSYRFSGSRGGCNKLWI